MSGHDEEIVQLLREIRDGQQAQLVAYREAGERLLVEAEQARLAQEKAIQTQAAAYTLQRKTALIYRFVVSGAALFAAFFLWKLTQS
jgi:hypothetical protein